MDTTDLLVPVEEYLNTSYHPDREYIDGVVVERNLGEKKHSRIQRKLIQYISNNYEQAGIEVFPEQRVQVTPTRFRVPDVTVVQFAEAQGEIFTEPPCLVIEILSREDSMQDMQEKVDDYLSFGIPYIWIINPRLQKGFVATSVGMIEAKSGFLETSDPAIRVPLSLIFPVS
jgi:Uma2 family endonuclease